MTTDIFREELKRKGLKITPQRVAIYEALVNLKNHPTAENITDFIKENHPNISVGTVYKVLDLFVAHNLIKKVKNDKDIMRYDVIISHHHHLYCHDTERIEDFTDSELDKIINDYFKNKKIEGFNIEDITLQINGKFKTN